MKNRAILGYWVEVKKSDSKTLIHVLKVVNKMTVELLREEQETEIYRIWADKAIGDVIDALSGVVKWGML
mgnify:CR=1 FL=1